MQVKVSVIIPVYGVEKYIERCARSLFEQTLDDMEYIFVDDCTPDNSIEVLCRVLDEYPGRKSQVKIIRMPVNSKQAAARTAGMKEACGQYMIHCDPDDWIELDAYRLMYENAIEKNADIVSCCFYIHDGGNVVKSGKAGMHSTGIECLLSLDYMFSLCSNMIKTSLVNKYDIYPFTDINCGEDLNTIFRAFYYSRCVVAIDSCLYHYNLANENSITNNDAMLLINTQSKKNIEHLECYFNNCKDLRVKRALGYLKIKLKKSLLWPYRAVQARNISGWCTTWTDSHKYLYDYPEFNRSQQLFFHTFANYPKILSIYFRYLDWRTK